MPLEITAVLVCDDIRKEVTNKETIIGVYSGDIVVPSFPSWFNSSLWIELFAQGPGTFDLKFRVGLTGKKPIEIGAKVTIGKSGNASIPLVGMQLQADQPSELIIECTLDKEWKIIKRKAVIQGAVTLPFPPIQDSPPNDSQAA